MEVKDARVPGTGGVQMIRFTSVKVERVEVKDARLPGTRRVCTRIKYSEP